MKNNKEPHKTIDNFCCACEYDLAVFEEELKEARQEEEQKWRKILNSGRTMYQMGRKEEKEKIKEIVKEMGKDRFCNCSREEGRCGYEQFRRDLLQAIDKEKEE